MDRPGNDSWQNEGAVAPGQAGGPLPAQNLANAPAAPAHSQTPSAPPDSETAPPRPACPVCGGGLVEIRGKLICARCRTICETCCEGGRG